MNRWSLPEAEQRWPEFTSLAKEVGLHSYLAAEIVTRVSGQAPAEYAGDSPA